MAKLEMDVSELRDFLNGDSPVRDQGARVIGYRDGAVLGDPHWGQRQSEIVDGRFVVRSRLGKELAQFPLANISCVVSVSVQRGGMFSDITRIYSWLVGDGGRPIAEVPWGNTVQEQAQQAGIPVRAPQMMVKTAAFKTLRPKLQLE